MKILHISSNGRRGGAGKAAWRLHQQLRVLGHDSLIMGLAETPGEDSAVQFPIDPETAERNRWLRELLVETHRPPVSNTWFSADLFDTHVATHPAVLSADVIHLHWIAELLTAGDVTAILKLNKPVIWTLHDMAAFTGGCHYSAGCDRFGADCSPCPQLGSLERDLAAAVLAEKTSWQANSNLTLVALSEWMQKTVGRSRVLSQTSTHLIRNGIDLTLYIPDSRAETRQQLGLAEDATVFLFVAESVAERRKGFDHLLASIRQLQSEPSVRNAVFLALGHPSAETAAAPIQFLGWKDDEREIAGIYAAADAFVITSLEDNLPNTVVESLACGTPVLGFAAGGVPEMVESGVSGELVPPGAAQALFHLLLRALRSPEWLRSMRPACRRAAESRFDLRPNTEAMLALYRSVLASHHNDSARRAQPAAGTREAIFRFLSVARPELLGLAPRDFLDKILAIHREAARSLRLDHEKRGTVIERQGGQLAALESQFHDRLNELTELYDRFENLQNERNLLQAQLADLQANFTAMEADRVSRGLLIEQMGTRLAQHEAEIGLRLSELNSVYAQREALKSERDLLAARLAELAANFQSVEADRTARGQVIEDQGRRASELEKLIWLTEQNRDWWRTEAERRGAPPPA